MSELEKRKRIRRQLYLATAVLSSIVATTSHAADTANNDSDNNDNEILEEADRRSASPGSSPVRRFERRQRRPGMQTTNDEGIQSIDGSGNNQVLSAMGMAHTQLRRLAPSSYADGVSSLATAPTPGPREISNAVAAQDGDRPNAVDATDFLWLWGQFVDHDLDLTDGIDPPESAPIPIPAGDPAFDPDGNGDAVMSFNRSLYDLDTGTGAANPRQQINEITAWIDGSNVYGSDLERAEELRLRDGSGRLKTSDGELLPLNVNGLPNAGGTSADLFLAGDVRANEHIGLTAMHTLFVREHNRLATRIRSSDPNLSGDEVYERARRIVIAELQSITFNEFLPVLLGPGAIGSYDGYDPSVDASIANEFSTAAYRLGHSALSSTLRRIDANGLTIDQGDIALRDAFFSPQRLAAEGGIEPLLRGMAAQRCQAIDSYVIDDVRNFLFGQPGAGGFDLVSLNIQRGRDHGLPSYNDLREGLGMPRKQSFAEVSSDPEIQQRLASVYQSPDDIDAWVGGLAEDKVPGAMVGELISRIVGDQFRALRDGDRFWYENVMTREQVRRIRRTRLSDVVRRNTSIGEELRDDVFRLTNSERGRRQR